MRTKLQFGYDNRNSSIHKERNPQTFVPGKYQGQSGRQM